MSPSAACFITDQKEANGNSLEGITGPGEGDGGARDAPASGGCSTGEGGVDQGGATSSVAGGEPNAPESIGEGASMGATGTTEEAGAGAGSGDSNCGGERSEGNSGRGGVASSGDSDFDDLLASYLEGSFGEAGGSLLVPLGGLRLLRFVDVVPLMTFPRVTDWWSTLKGPCALKGAS